MDEQKPAEKQDLGIIEKAEAAAARLEAANKRYEELLARQALAGKAEAGVTPPIQKEETAQEYARRILKGRI